MPDYNYAIVALRDILKIEGDKRGDGIEQTRRYFECLPTNMTAEIDLQITNRNLAEISFQKSSNVDFFITIVPEQFPQRMLRISPANGFIQIHPFSGSFYKHINIPAAQIDYESNTDPTNSKSFIYDGLKSFIKIQAGLSETNK